MSRPQEGPPGQAIKSIATVILDLPPCCMELCPAHPTFAVVGTYHLEVDAAPSSGQWGQIRTGSLVVYEISAGRTLEHVQTLAQPSALLDLRFHPVHPTVFAAASSTATISLFSFSPPPPSSASSASAGGRGPSPLAHISTIKMPWIDPTVMVLQIAWIPRAGGGGGDCGLAATAATGQAWVLAPERDARPRVGAGAYESGRAAAEDEEYGASAETGTVRSGLEGWRAGVRSGEIEPIRNESLAWCVGVAPVESGSDGQAYATIYASGEDSILRCAHVAVGGGGKPTTDQPAEQLPLPTTAPITTSDRSRPDVEPAANVPAEPTRPRQPPSLSIKDLHEAGITAVVPLSIMTTTATAASRPSRLVLTGSYDNHIRLLSVPEPHLGQQGEGGVARVLAEADLGGGVWRIKVIDIAGGEAGSEGTAGAGAGADADAASTGATMMRGNSQRRKIRALVSCMFAGARVVEISETAPGHDQGGERIEGSWTISVLARFEEHESMNYASDFRVVDGGGVLACLSVSFYDKRLCLWEVALDRGAVCSSA